MAAVSPINDRKRIPTLVKNSALVEEKRRRIVEAAVGLFISKGFHVTTTREIARAVGFSIGSLYEYVASKEDILYLVCEAIHAEIEAQLGRDTAQGETCEGVAMQRVNVAAVALNQTPLDWQPDTRKSSG